MVFMTDINTAAVAARENARQATGRFGEQEHSAPEIALTSISENYGSVDALSEALAHGDLDADGVHAMLEGIASGSADEIIAENYGGLAELEEGIAMGDVDADGIRAMLENAAQTAGTSPARAPFVFDRNYDNHEQVRPYMDDFNRVHDEIVASGRYAYNDSFKGRIPSLAGTDSKNEDTAIYMMQNLRQLDIEDAKRQEFIESGGRKVTVDDLTPGLELRGTVVRSGFYMGGTGWEEHENVRLRRHTYPNGRTELVYVEKGKRNGHSLGDADIYFRES